MQVSYLLLDLDDTIYPASSGFHREIDRRMTEYVARFLNVSLEEAAARRKVYWEQYGTTLKGLLRHHNFSRVDEYLDHVHPTNLQDYILMDPHVAEILASIPLRKSILTNSPREHALRVLDYLGIRDQFEHIFDLRFNGYEGKPGRAAYTRALEAIGRRPEEVLFVDDKLSYLLPFRRMGGRILLVSEAEDAEAAAQQVPRIGSIHELPVYLGLRSPGPAAGAPAGAPDAR